MFNSWALVSIVRVLGLGSAIVKCDDDVFESDTSNTAPEHFVLFIGTPQAIGNGQAYCTFEFGRRSSYLVICEQQREEKQLS